MKRTRIVALLLCGACAVQAQIAKWTFETYTAPVASPGAGIWLTNIPAEIGSGTASALHAGAATYSTPSGNGSAKSLSANTWSIGDVYQFAVSTVGFTGIGVSFDQASSQTGPGRFNLAYSTDGVNFTTHVTNYVVLQSGGTLPPGTWNNVTYDPQYTFVYDLSLVSALDNSPTVYFRLIDSSTISASGGTVNASAGASRVDNFTVFSPVPEPTGVSLVWLGGLILAMVAKRKRV